MHHITQKNIQNSCICNALYWMLFYIYSTLLTRRPFDRLLFTLVQKRTDKYRRRSDVFLLIR